MEITLVLLGLGAFALLVYFGYLESKWETKYDPEKVDIGKVVDMSYAASHTSSSVHPVVTGKSVGVGFSSHTTPERHIVVIRGEDVYRKVIFDSERLYDEVEEGMSVKLLYANKYRQHKETRERHEKGLRLRGLEVNGVIYRDLNVIETDYKLAKGA